MRAIELKQRIQKNPWVKVELQERLQQLHLNIEAGTEKVAKRAIYIDRQNSVKIRLELLTPP